MPAYALLIAFPHLNGKPEVISGPEVSYQDQREKFKKSFAAERVHKKYAKVELLHSHRGVTKSKNFIHPEEAKRREIEIARQEKEFADSKTPAKVKAEKGPVQPPAPEDQ